MLIRDIRCYLYPMGKSQEYQQISFVRSLLVALTLGGTAWAALLYVTSRILGVSQ